MKIIGCKPVGEEEVYDLSVDHEDHSFVHSSGVIAHNCAYVIANRPIHEFIPLTTVSDVRVTSYTAPAVEASGGLKMDFLVINSLNDLRDAICDIQKRHGHLVDMSRYKIIEHEEDLVGWHGPPVKRADGTTVDRRFSVILNGKRVPCQRLVPKNGALYDIWDLPEDQSVFADVARSNTETVFQFNTPGARQWLRQFGYQKPDGTYAIDSIEAMAAFTALDRPGPLDMFVPNPEDSDDHHNLLVEYARRARGAQPSNGVLKVFDELIPETYGVMVYQEQLQKVYQNLTGCSGAAAEEFRSDVAKKKKSSIEKAYTPFIEKAGAKIGKENAEKAWQFFITWAKYGFNKSHAVCYSVIGYACAWLKHHYPLEWWCAVLKNATKAEINEKFWKHAGRFVDLPDVVHSGPFFNIVGNRIKAPLNLLHGIGETAHNQLVKYMPYTDIDDLVKKIVIHREATKYPVIKHTTIKDNGKKKTTFEKVDPTTVDLETWPVWKLGHNALNRKILRTLIMAGAMDPLFPKTKTIQIGDTSMEVEITLAEQLDELDRALAQHMKRKKTKKERENEPDLLGISGFERFQMRKAILPMYSEDLSELVYDMRIQKAHKDADGRLCIVWKSPFYRNAEEDTIRVAYAHEIEELDNATMLPNPPYIAAAVAYVELHEPFSFEREDGRKEACRLMLDIEGLRLNLTKWGNKEGLLPDKFKQPLAGSIVLVVLNKYREGKAFGVEDLILLKAPLDHKSSEESADEEENE